METLQDEGKTDPERQRQMAAIRFYLHCVIWECEGLWNNVARGITNYVTLLDQLRRSRPKNEPVLLVTFNYDRMIESALSSVDISISELPHYIQYDAFKLFKPHGSVHWAREIENPVTNLGERNVWEVARELINIAPDLKITDRFRIVVSYPIGTIDEIPLFPAIAIPVETKLDFECPPDHLDCLSTFVAADQSSPVGWAAQEGHLRGPRHEDQGRVIPSWKSGPFLFLLIMPPELPLRCGSVTTPFCCGYIHSQRQPMRRRRGFTAILTYFSSRWRLVFSNRSLWSRCGCSWWWASCYCGHPIFGTS